MFRNVILSTVLLITASSLFGQVEKPETTTVNYDDNVYTATQITLELPQDKVKDYWDNYWDERFDIDIDREDRSRNSEVFLAEQVSLVAISDKAFDLWSKLTELDADRTVVALSIGFGYDISANPNDHPAAFNQAEKYLDEFRVFAYSKFYDEKIAELQSQLEDVRDDREDAVDDQQKSNRRIERWLEKIEKLEGRIAEERAAINEEEALENTKEQRIAEIERELNDIERLKRRYTRQ